MRFIFIDTNIWIRLLTHGKPDGDLKWLEELHYLIQKKQLTLLLPEIVSLELEKFSRSISDSLRKHTSTLSKDIHEKIKISWNEIDDIKDAILELVESRRTDKDKHSKDTYQKIKDTFSIPHIIHLPFSIEVMLASHKRLIAGRMPVSAEKSSNDAYIVESLITHFKAVLPTDELLFVSENRADFCLKTDSGDILHPLVSEQLPPTKYFTKLDEAINFHNTNKSVELPTDEIIEEALEKEIETRNPYPPPKLRKCAILNCQENVWWIGPYCPIHFSFHKANKSSDHTNKLRNIITEILQSLTYREREVLKLRSGIADGYIYTTREVAHIFKTEYKAMRQIEREIMKKTHLEVFDRAIMSLR